MMTIPFIAFLAVFIWLLFSLFMQSEEPPKPDRQPEPGEEPVKAHNDDEAPSAADALRAARPWR